MSMKNFVEQCAALAAGWEALAIEAEKDKRYDDAARYRQRAEINLSLVAKFG